MTADLTPPSVDQIVAFLFGEAEIDGASFGDKHPWHGGRFWWRPMLRDAITALRSQIATERALADKAIAAEQARATAAEAALAAAMEGATKVKPLEWRVHENDQELHMADSILGLYFVRFDPRANDDTAWMLFLSGKWVCFGSLEAAKAAAQADYERRILAALEPNPAAQDREALAGADWLIDLIGELGRAAFDIADNVEEDAETGILTAWQPSFIKLCLVLDQIEEKTPDQDERGHYLGIGARLQCALKALLATQPQTDALAALRREARVEGMRMAAKIKKTPEFGDDWMGMSCAILAAAEQEARP